MRQLVAGNWKMNGLRQASEEVVAPLLSGAQGLGCDVLICPPATLIHRVAEQVAGSAVQLGGQDCHAKASGAHTGDISAVMLRDAGAAWVILGHSERRADHGESNALVQSKVAAAVQAGLQPIVCVGETQAQRVAGVQNDVVAQQVIESLPADFMGVVAYEPVWAIGTGLTPSLADVAAMHNFIRGILVGHLGDAGQSLRILYGGSVKASNAAEILAIAEVGGALVGGASLVATEFLAIARAASVVAEADAAG